MKKTRIVPIIRCLMNCNFIVIKIGTNNKNRVNRKIHLLNCVYQIEVVSEK